MRSLITFSLALCALCGWHGHACAQYGASPAPARPALTAQQLALIVNDDDDNSVAVAALYRQARNVPAANIVHVKIPGRPRKLTAAQFDTLKKRINAQLGPEIQAILMVWTAPYAVECNSITSAMTLGLDPAPCQPGCHPAKPSPYYNSLSARPFSELAMRPSMLLPADTVARAKALIARGVASGGGFRTPQGSAYYLITSEGPRNSRAHFFPPTGRIEQKKLAIRTMKSNALEGAHDVMIYQTGMARVAKLDTLTFLPGALADHLTSTGGDLLGETQMSSLRWLEAGATASYGTVSEPCNFWQKFPQPVVLLQHYLAGESAIEAYWKSVAWPAQGVFIGEPLAAPYHRANQGEQK